MIPQTSILDFNARNVPTKLLFSKQEIEVGGREILGDILSMQDVFIPFFFADPL